MKNKKIFPRIILVIISIVSWRANAFDSMDPVENMAISSYNSDETAVTRYKKEIEEHPEPKKTSNKEAKALNEKALNFIKSQQYKWATPLLEQANLLDPYDIEIMNNFGFALSKSDRLGQAEFVLNLVLRNKPDRAAAWENYAHILALKGEHELAIGAYANALRFSKNRNFTIGFLKKQLETETNDYVRLAISNALEKSNQIAEWQECTLPINLGDTEERAQEVFKFTTKTNTFNSNQRSYRHMNLSNIGINMFFVDGKIDSITLTSPFCGNINGINIGDNLTTLKIKMGDPEQSPSSWGRRTYSYGIKQNTIFNFSVDNYNVIESIRIDANRN